MSMRKRINDVYALKAAADMGRAVVVPGTTYSKPCPAAWMINLQGHVLCRLFKSGMYEYIKIQKEREEQNHDTDTEGNTTK